MGKVVFGNEAQIGLEEEAEEKMLREVFAIYERYGWNGEKLIEQGSR